MGGDLRTQPIEVGMVMQMLGGGEEMTFGDGLSVMADYPIFGAHRH